AGFAAMFCSLALVTASVAMALRTDGGMKLGIGVEFPESTPEASTEMLSINFAQRQPGDARTGQPGRTGPAGSQQTIIAAEKSDLVIDAWPRGVIADSETFDINTFPRAQLALELPDIGIVREPMDIISSAKAPGTPPKWHFRKILHSMARDVTLWVEWVDGTHSRRYTVTLMPPLRIEDHEIVYRVPMYMRTRDVNVQLDGRVNWKAVVVPTDDGAGLVVTMPELDKDRHPVVVDGSYRSVTHTFASESAFELAEPETYRAWARESSADPPAVTHTEEADVLFRIDTNKPLDAERSYLGVDRPAQVRRTAEGEAEAPAPQTRFALTRRPDDTNGTKWIAHIRLARDMKAYWFHLVDADGLRSAEDSHYPIQVRRDRPPTSRFVDTGVPLTEGSAERHATPNGSFPLIVSAEDEFGLRGLRLQYRRGSDPEDRWQDVPGFGERIASRISSQPPSITVRFTVDLVPLFRDVPVTDDAQTSLLLRLIARDTKDQTNEQSAAPLAITIWTPEKLRSEIRQLLRNVIRPRIQDLRTWQAGLVNASRLFRAGTPDDLRKGVKISRVFPDEERTTDSRGLPIMFDGSRAVRLQNKITDDARTLARRIDAIVRHFIYNELERDDADAPQETALQKMKVLLALLCVEKRVALELDKHMTVFSAAGTSDPDRTSAINLLLKGLFTEPVNDRSPGDAPEPGSSAGLRLLEIRPGYLARFNIAMQRLLKDLRLSATGTSLEAALRYDAANADGAVAETVREQLDEALLLQEQSERSLGQVLDLLRQWEGFEEQREQLRRIRITQAEVQASMIEMQKVNYQIGRLKDPNPAVGRDACAKLAEIDRQFAITAVPALRAIVDDPSADTRLKEAARQAIRTITGNADN
ncbi:MAG: hypothetical protein AB7K09_17140, partial [Planctomycetota bacterium]